MAEIITMPRLSDTMTEGTVATWLKKVGDKVSEGDILAEIETDKATMEFESFQSGTLLYIGIQEGETAPVDSVLVIIGKEGEDYKQLLESGNADKEKSEEPETADTSESQEKEKASGEIPEGVEIITMPRLSDTMTEGTVATWLKKVGDKVSEGDILAEIETDKATMEFESFQSGTLLYIGIQEGETAPVDSVLAIIGKEGEDYKQLLESGNADKEKSEEPETADSSESQEEEKASGEIPEGVEIITMPRLSDTMTEGTVATWLKKVGDKVSEGDILAEIETDKATMEFESFYSGTLLHIGIQEGESAPVDSSH